MMPHPTEGQREPTRIFVSIGPALRPRLFVPAALRALEALGRVEYQPADKRLSESELAEMARGCRILVTGWQTPLLGSALCDACPGLGLIAHSGVSVRPVVDECLFRAGIRVTNTGDAMVIPVAEFTLMQILRALRPPASRAMGPAADGWSVLALEPGAELAGCAIGVVGAGQIGRRVIRLLRAFDATVRVYDPLLPGAEAAALGVSPAGLDELLRVSRIVTLHAPALPATVRMIGAAQLAAMPDGAWLVNTARPSLVDTDALVRELRTGRISAALDVFDREPLPDDSPLRGLPNALLTHHAAFLTRECLQRLGDRTVAEIGRFIRGEPLQNEVTLAMLGTMA